VPFVQGVVATIGTWIGLTFWFVEVKVDVGLGLAAKLWRG
jgi:hypothetical protein